MARQRLKYHREAAKLLGWSSPALRPGEAQLAEVETRLGQLLPASVREWIVHFGDLRACAGQDHPVGSSRLGAPTLVRRGSHYDAIADGYLILMWENQGCCHWAVKLGVGDDPPVFQSEGLSEATRDWRPLADRFSEFVLARVWSMSQIFDARYNWLSVGAPLGVRELAYLRATMKEGPITTDWPCGVHHRFSYADAYVWMYDDQWMAGSHERSSLEDLTRRVWWFAGTRAESSNTDFEESLDATRVSQPPFLGPGWEKLFGDALDERFANGCFLGSREDEAVVPPALDELLDDFDEAHRLPLAGGLLALTLARPGQRIYLVTGDHRDPEARSAWWLHGGDVAGLAALARHLLRWGMLPATLRAATDAGREALRAAGE